MSTDSIEQYVFWILKVSCSFKMFDAIRSEWQNSKTQKTQNKYKFPSHLFLVSILYMKLQWNNKI